MPYERGRRDRALCPVCGYSVRVASGCLSTHPDFTAVIGPGQERPRCAGSGREVEA